MSIATDARYRSILLSFANNEQDGSEFVQLLAKASGGNWSAQRTFPVALTADQETTWDTALPLTLYDIALRYMIGSVAAEGYESSDPDAWTASTAAGSKGTVTTGCAAVTDLAGSAFVSSGTPISLTWSCANLAVPFLLEKNAGAGWVTVVADLVATSYSYTIPSGELGGTTQFRVTPKRGAIAGTTSGSISVLMSIVVGATAFTSATFSTTTRVASLAWSAATQAANYLLEKSLDAGANYSTIGTISGLTYDYAVPDAEINTTVRFRVRGQSGATQGASATTNLAMTLVVGTSVLSGQASWDTVQGFWKSITPTNVPGLSWTAATNATAYRLQYNIGAGWVTIGSVSQLTAGAYVGTGYTLPLTVLNTVTSFRVVPTNGSIDGTASNVVTFGFPITVPGAPTGVTAVRSAPALTGVITVSWGAASGDVAFYAVYFRKTVDFSYYGGTLAPGTSFQFNDEGQVECYVVASAGMGRIPGGTSATVAVTGP